jgi:FkbM family methyltransferase
MISYAQNFEDVILRRVFRDRKDGFYIDIGAMDPVVDSVTKFFYDQGWSGINVEPNDWFYGKLQQERPRDINLNLAVGEREEDKEIFLFEHIGNSTFDESSRDRYVDQGFEAKAKRVRVTTLAKICQDYVRREIDFLKIDCEGWEKFVIWGADWDRFRPIVLVIEATEPGTSTPFWSEWEPYLIENGRYRFYLQRECAHLRSSFDLPPNLFDEFKLYATEAAEQANQVLLRERENFLWRIGVLEQERNSALAENSRLADSFRAKETELEAEASCTRTRIAELDASLQAKDRELEAQASCTRTRIAELETERCELKKNLQKTRLWVGRLSQDLAASKRR